MGTQHTLQFAHVAQRYLVSMDATQQIYDALQKTDGMFAQFDHPDLGGRGQWMPGMCQIGDLNNEPLRSRINGLCAELSAMVKGSESAADGALASSPTAEPTDRAGGPVGESWWPAALGHPAATGEQDGVRYAYFPDQRRLAVQLAGRVTVYYTGRHRIHGIAQKHGSPAALHFTSQLGDLSLDTLRVVPH